MAAFTLCIGIYSLQPPGGSLGTVEVPPGHLGDSIAGSLAADRQVPGSWV